MSSLGGGWSGVRMDSVGGGIMIGRVGEEEEVGCQFCILELFPGPRAVPTEKMQLGVWAGEASAVGGLCHQCRFG